MECRPTKGSFHPILRCEHEHRTYVWPDGALLQIGIPTMRVNTGRWGTSKDFDTLMANRGIEPPLPGYTEEDGLPMGHRCPRAMFTNS